MNALRALAARRRLFLGFTLGGWFFWALMYRIVAVNATAWTASDDYTAFSIFYDLLDNVLSPIVLLVPLTLLTAALYLLPHHEK